MNGKRLCFMFQLCFIELMHPQALPSYIMHLFSGNPSVQKFFLHWFFFLTKRYTTVEINDSLVGNDFVNDNQRSSKNCVENSGNNSFMIEGYNVWRNIRDKSSSGQTTSVAEIFYNNKVCLLSLIIYLCLRSQKGSEYSQYFIITINEV